MPTLRYRARRARQDRLGCSDIGGDPIVAVMTEQLSDAHPAGLRKDGVSYIFAGEQDLDPGLALEILKRLRSRVAAARTGAFLRAGLIDEISLVICPAERLTPAEVGRV
jgi:riboflavin biosynthesis pyrimidine reductase